ncbi:antibiotic biosynthesis monooxygenase [Rhizobium sp. ARZ01]|uniref:putative quinol monooxygenase n=1 Tax=Rhizobium sp. ARZ01 TaxID=2769313 RepID=UPI00177C5D4B|nr:putative quinol monooxygenase [Rhizobium sp. ARZ01]MBD9371439.1 antibiotic biosynthesis monooxygenase [Rhizobium sp. ARZ01]
MAETDRQDSVRKVVRLQARAGQADRMRTALAELRKATIVEAGCREFDFYQSISEPGLFLLVEDFASHAALDTHMHLAHTRAFFALDLVASIDPIKREWLS